MLIEFQIGAKQPPLDNSVTILDVEELLEDNEKRIFVLLKKLALLEEENTVHRQEAARASAHHVETKEHLESLLVKTEKELAQLEVLRIEEQKVATTKLEQEKAYGKIVYKSYLTVKKQNRKGHDELEKARILNLTWLDELAEWKEKAKELQQELNKAIMKNETLGEEVNDLNETTEQVREATCPNSGDTLKHIDNEREAMPWKSHWEGHCDLSVTEVCHQVHSVDDGMGKVCLLVRFCLRFCLSFRMNCTSMSNCL